jgi:hypothetical protein
MLTLVVRRTPNAGPASHPSRTHPERTEHVSRTHRAPSQVRHALAPTGTGLTRAPPALSRLPAHGLPLPTAPAHERSEVCPQKRQRHAAIRRNLPRTPPQKLGLGLRAGRTMRPHTRTPQRSRGTQRRKKPLLTKARGSVQTPRNDPRDERKRPPLRRARCAHPWRPVLPRTSRMANLPAKGLARQSLVPKTCYQGLFCGTTAERLGNDFPRPITK